jgi:glycosyltransferase involved in cell wall biosynthesis
MKFVFWQNIISIHQSAFLSTLAAKYSVVLVVEKEFEEQRKDHGWNIPSMGKSNIVVAPSKDQIYELIKNNIDSIHVFSGTHAFPMVGKAFDIACSFKIKILVYAEPYRFLGIKGWLRKYKYQIEFFKYGKCIDALLPTGTLGYKCFQQSGFPKNKMFQWGYFTEQPEEIPNFKGGHLPSLLFVGSIDERKNILYLVDICKKLKDQFDHLSIVGVGHLTGQLQKSIEGINNIYYLGYRSNTEVKDLMFQHDILVLPSIFDGWGAVINEALQSGMSVVASENCGASILLDGNQRGEVFSFNKGDDLETVLKRRLAKERQSIVERKAIIEWSNKAISGDSAANYFINICEYVFIQKGDKPIAPWISNNN